MRSKTKQLNEKYGGYWKHEGSGIWRDDRGRTVRSRVDDQGETYHILDANGEQQEIYLAKGNRGSQKNRKNTFTLST